MITLNRNLRKDLENAIRKARPIAEKGALDALERLAVKEPNPWPTLTDNQKALRRRLRARARQLGDKRDPKSEAQEINRLAQECAYEQWNRLIFARFLAEVQNFVPMTDTNFA
jgi:hypothetical protein